MTKNPPQRIAAALNSIARADWHYLRHKLDLLDVTLYGFQLFVCWHLLSASREEMLAGARVFPLIIALFLYLCWHFRRYPDFAALLRFNLYIMILATGALYLKLDLLPI